MIRAKDGTVNTATAIITFTIPCPMMATTAIASRISGKAKSTSQHLMMKTDIREHDAGYEVDIDLPGFKKDEISIELENGYLTVSAAKGLDKDEEDKKGKYIRKERYAGAMQRSFYVGENLTQEDIKAKYERGILRLSVPKKEAKPVETKKTIAIEG